MKKLLLMTFAILTVSAFAAEENKETNQVEKNVKIESQQVIQKTEMSLGESFMEAFGMSEGGQQSGSESVGVTSSSANTATVNANNNVTIVTPYGKY